MPQIAEDKSVTDLLRQMAEDGAHLARREVSLARIEFSDAARDVGHGTVFAVAAALFGLLSVQMLLFGLVLLMGAELLNGRWWIAAVAVAAVLAVATALLFARAKALLSPKNVVPDQTLASLRGETHA